MEPFDHEVRGDPPNHDAPGSPLRRVPTDVVSDGQFIIFCHNWLVTRLRPLSNLCLQHVTHQPCRSYSAAMTFADFFSSMLLALSFTKSACVSLALKWTCCEERSVGAIAGGLLRYGIRSTPANLSCLRTRERPSPHRGTPEESPERGLKQRHFGQKSTTLTMARLEILNNEHLPT